MRDASGKSTLQTSSSKLLSRLSTPRHKAANVTPSPFLTPLSQDQNSLPNASYKSSKTQTKLFPTKIPQHPPESILTPSDSQGPFPSSLDSELLPQPKAAHKQKHPLEISTSITSRSQLEVVSDYCFHHSTCLLHKAPSQERSHESQEEVGEVHTPHLGNASKPALKQVRWQSPTVLEESPEKPFLLLQLHDDANHTRSCELHHCKAATETSDSSWISPEESGLTVEEEHVLRERLEAATPSLSPVLNSLPSLQSATPNVDKLLRRKVHRRTRFQRSQTIDQTELPLLPSMIQTGLECGSSHLQRSELSRSTSDGIQEIQGSTNTATVSNFSDEVSEITRGQQENTNTNMKITGGSVDNMQLVDDLMDTTCFSECSQQDNLGGSQTPEPNLKLQQTSSNAQGQKQCSKKSKRKRRRSSTRKPGRKQSRNAPLDVSICQEVPAITQASSRSSAQEETAQREPCSKQNSREAQQAETRQLSSAPGEQYPPRMTRRTAALWKSLGENALAPEFQELPVRKKRKRSQSCGGRSENQAEEASENDLSRDLSEHQAPSTVNGNNGETTAESDAAVPSDCKVGAPPNCTVQVVPEDNTASSPNSKNLHEPTSKPPLGNQVPIKYHCTIVCHVYS